MKVALATWNGRISPGFDIARQVLMLDAEEGRVVARCEETLPGTERRLRQAPSEPPPAERVASGSLPEGGMAGASPERAQQQSPGRKP